LIQVTNNFKYCVMYNVTIIIANIVFFNVK